MKTLGFFSFLLLVVEYSSATKEEVVDVIDKNVGKFNFPFVTLQLHPIHKTNVSLSTGPYIYPAIPDAYQPLSKSDIHKSQVAYEKLNKIWSNESFVKQIDPYSKAELGPYLLKFGPVVVPITLTEFSLYGINKHTLYSFTVRGRHHPVDRVDKTVTIPEITVVSDFDVLGVQGHLRLDLINVTLNSATRWSPRRIPRVDKLQIVTALNATVDVPDVTLRLWLPDLWKEVVSCQKLSQVVVDHILDEVLQTVADLAVKEWNVLVLAQYEIIPDD